MRRFGPGSLLIGVLLALGGCGGGGGDGGSPASAAPATVGVLITDAPTLAVDEALATITRVELLGGGAPVVLFRGTQTLDLLKLGDFSELFAVSDTVPPGTYSKIRLRLSDLVLNRLDPETGAVIESIHPQLVGNGKIDLNPRGPFTVGPGEVIFVELDFDMDKALKITTTGNGGKVIVRPVVFVDIHTDRAAGRLARVHGRITAVDFTAATLRLCQTGFASRWEDGPVTGLDDGHCLTVHTDAATGVFDTEGLPQDFAGLEVGEEATAIGRLARLGDGAHSGTGDRLRMDAVVITEGPLGTYRRLAGTAASALDPVSSRFKLDLAPGQGFGSDSSLAVQLFDQSRVFSRSGEELGREQIAAGVPALADGVLQIGAETLLRSPLVVLDLEPPAGAALLEGEVVFVDIDESSLIVFNGTADRCVRAGTAAVFLVNDDDGFSATRGALADLHPGQDVAIFGAEAVDGCVVAGTILAEE